MLVHPVTGTECLKWNITTVKTQVKEINVKLEKAKYFINPITYGGGGGGAFWPRLSDY